MKLMKHITIALVLCAIPAVAAAQDVSCDECTHVLSVYYGDGGLIAEADGDMVTYVATCEGVTRSGEMMPNDDGVVSMLIDHDNHLACHGDDEGNSFEIGPVKDGGWYWLTMATNSAVGNLVSKDILGNETTMIADAGDGVTMVMGKGAVLLTETATGRTGLLPNILPTMEMEAVDPTVCGFARNAAGGAATAAAGYSQVRNNCMMGDGGTITLATTTNGFTGATEMVANGGMVYRPAAGASGTVVVTVDLWGNHSGFFTADPAGAAWLGQPAFALTALRAATRLTGVTIGGTLAASGPGTGTDLSTPAAGITLAAGTDSATFTIAADAAYCSADGTANHSATVNVTATLANPAIVTPSIKVAAAGATHHGATSFTVVCQGASANMGQELVPENPFPTE